ncbi:MAG: hypothetical protein GTO45_30815 [Candidatus Aminicenantes bacterium]|nr:hypothetical protein [Candidatus Aminicenantes bacterium]NIM83183.1 hypothetical protein [Candidatus Aminicenantes bacterium]NIN22560.1 hypothetical protein [Candidatus Aminicenantes bacterium]NIN46329.1 hypothetical protein [Candidatus Aminicenantes bacterium]NIN89170.1 hypothetical protein [Candidatus Aminicenantes bacterium]
MSTSGTNDPKVKEWKAKFDNEFERKKGEWEALSKSTESRGYYTLGYWIDALTAMYETTGDKEYLRRALTYVRSVIKLAVPAPQFKDGYLGWISKYRDENRETPLYESCMWRYVARILRMIKETPVLYDDPDSRDFFQEVLPFTETHIWEKWYNRGRDHKYIYRSRTHIASHWAFIALNMLKVSTDETKRSQYQQVLSKINNDLRKNLYPAQNDPDAYFWHATWDPASIGDPYESGAGEVQDVSHGNHVISYVTESFEQDVFWNYGDITKFGSTLKKIVWDPSNCDFFDFVNGTYGEVDGWGHPGRRQSDGWVKLGRFDREIQRIYEQYLKDNPDAAGFAKQLAQLLANMALNEKKLSEKKESSKLIQLTSPVGGETLEAGKRHRITWSDKKFEGTVNIEYSTDNGNSWETIASGTPNDGARGWLVPDITSNQCLVRIRRTDGSAEDVTGTVFSIVRG